MFGNNPGDDPRNPLLPKQEQEREEYLARKKAAAKKKQDDEDFINAAWAALRAAGLSVEEQQSMQSSMTSADVEQQKSLLAMHLQRMNERQSREVELTELNPNELEEKITELNEQIKTLDNEISTLNADRRAAAAGVFDSVTLGSILVVKSENPSFFEGVGHVTMVPFAPFFGMINTGLAWRKMLTDRKEDGSMKSGNQVRTGVETVSFGAVAAAVGTFFAGGVAATVAAPLFIAALSLKTAYHMAYAAYAGIRSWFSKDSATKEKYKAKAWGNLATAGLCAIGVVAVTGVMLLNKATFGIAGAVGGGLGAIYAAKSYGELKAKGEAVVKGIQAKIDNLTGKKAELEIRKNALIASHANIPGASAGALVPTNAAAKAGFQPVVPSGNNPVPVAKAPASAVVASSASAPGGSVTGGVQASQSQASTLSAFGTPATSPKNAGSPLTAAGAVSSAFPVASRPSSPSSFHYGQSGDPTQFAGTSSNGVSQTADQDLAPAQESKRAPSPGKTDY